MLNPVAAGGRRGRIGARSAPALCLLAVLAVIGRSDAHNGTALHAWLELGPDGERIARVITTEAECPSIVLGDSGTELDPAVTSPLDGLEVAWATVTSSSTLDEFGFATLEASGEGWSLTLRDLAGGVLRACTLGGVQVACAPAAGAASRAASPATRG